MPQKAVVYAMAGAAEAQPYRTAEVATPDQGLEEQRPALVR